MLSQAEQANANLEEARNLRASGRTYRDVRRILGLTSSQLCHIRRALKREKAARTRLLTAKPEATDRELPVGQSVLPSGLRKILTASGYITLGDLADRVAESGLPVLEAIPGVGPHRARLVRALLDYYGLFSGPSDLQAAVEHLFPEFCDAASGDQKHRIPQT